MPFGRWDATLRLLADFADLRCRRLRRLSVIIRFRGATRGRRRGRVDPESKTWSVRKILQKLDARFGVREKNREERARANLDRLQKTAIAQLATSRERL